MPLVVESADLNSNLIIGLIGDTRNGTGGKINRTLPAAHPMWPWMFCTGISNIVGLGRFTKITSETELEAPTLSHYARYTRYQLTTEWAPRPYAVLSNDAVDLQNITWYDDDNNPESAVIATEWLRYTTYTVAPRSELVTGTQGQMVFRLVDTMAKGTPIKPHLYGFPGHPRMHYPTVALRYRWHMVPLRYVDSSNSHITRFIGRVNQLAWNGYAAGTLLYEGVSMSEPYVPAVPELSVIADETDYSTFKLVDIEFNFLYTDRDGDGWSPTIANRNWVPTGHNALPWIGDRKFYYATFRPLAAADDVPAVWTPTYLSFPFQLLFTDPDLS